MRMKLKNGNCNRVTWIRLHRGVGCKIANNSTMAHDLRRVTVLYLQVTEMFSQMAQMDGLESAGRCGLDGQKVIKITFFQRRFEFWNINKSHGV